MYPIVYLSAAACPDRGDERPVMALGTFDGVHRGHQALLGRLVAHARALGRPALVFTFHPSPSAVLGRGDPRAILPLEERIRLLGEFGVDRVVVERFSQAYAVRSARWFAREVLGRLVRPAALVVGRDFRFGHQGAGGVESLAEWMPDLEVEVVEACLEQDLPVSSSRIRKALAAGRVAEVATLLGRPWAVTGTVSPGQGLGRRLGFPTANLVHDADLLPADGVYAVRARVDGGAPEPAVASLGTRPTFDGEGFVLEVHLLRDPEGPSEDALYGTPVEIGFVDRIRDQERFRDASALVRAIRKDTEQARRILAPEGPCAAGTGRRT
ncbi:MAG: riboflavin biosynthesis protein RibF [Deltaproteobacteria bacterium]|nr:riboflavin biosynthesis protein RibF [Deltaproteobacteria bacterium]